MKNELPGEWGNALGPRGIHSYRDVAAKVDISAGTAHRLMTGGATSVETVNKVADALFDGDRDEVWRLRGSSRRDFGDWSLPADASLLDPDQREAIVRLVQVMVPKDDAAKPAGLKEVLDRSQRLRAVASDLTGESATSADEADAIAKRARAEQEANIAEMKRKKAEKTDPGE